MLVSATFPAFTQKFIKANWPDVKLINVMEELTLIGVTQYYVYVE